MKKMLLMRGAPGSGKTTAIAEAGLTDYVVSMDDIRATFAPSVPTTTGATYALHHTIQKKVATFALDAVTYLAQMGQTIVIDALNLRIRDQNRYITIAHRYGYEVYLYDAQGQISDEDLLARNASRPATDQIDPAVVVKKAAEGRQRWLAPGVTEVSSVREFADMLTYPVHDFDRYDTVVVVGDVQSCGDQLAHAVGDIGGFGQPDTAWVFVGDLYDRGESPVTVHHLIDNAPENVFIVEGNHDRHMRTLIGFDKAPRDTHRTRELLNAAGISDTAIMRVIDRTVPLLAFTRGGRHYLVTHGGVRPSDCLTGVVDIDGSYRLQPTTADWSFMFGQSDQAHTYARTSDYAADTSTLDDGGFIQFYGHRNGGFDEPARPAKVTDRLYALESRVENGGHLTVAVIDRSGEIDIRTFDDSHEPTLEDKLRTNPNVRAKDIGDGITAYNFTRDAFRKRLWDTQTIAARGLFIRDGEVVARGYNKFFNEGEFPGPTMMTYARNATYPVTVTNKENGFLALLSCIDGKLTCYTKAGPTGFARHARELVDQMIDTDTLSAVLERENATAAVEVIHPSDPHIIDYRGQVRLFLLDLIANEEVMSLHADEDVDDLATKVGFERPERRLARTAEELYQWLSVGKLATHEGYVFKDRANAMMKVKSDYYTWAKRVRGAIQRVLSGKATEEQAGIDHIAFTAPISSARVSTWLGEGVDVTRVLDYSTYVSTT